MEGVSNSAPCSSKQTVVLDAKPLRCLSPMFPAPLGFTTSSSSSALPFVRVTPTGPFPSGFESVLPSGFSPGFPTFGTAEATARRPPDPVSRTTNNGNAHAMKKNVHRSQCTTNPTTSFHTPPPTTSFHTPPVVVSLNDDEGHLFDGSNPTSASGRTIKQPMYLNSYRMGSSETESTGGKKVKRKRIKVQNSDLLMLSSSSHDPRESVEVILMTFDALRRRLLQLDEMNDVNKRPDLKAGGIMMGNDLRANMGKRMGPVPGIEVGDIFYFRIEMCVVGLHAPSMGGIDYMTARFDDKDDSVAIAIVSAGVYENEEDDADVLVYSGQGGSKYDKKPLDDQKLQRGNLALERSLHRANEIRVIRSAKDPTCQSGKIYIYDGIYKIHESWVEKAKSGFNVFKYKLLREPGQPDGIAVWKMTQKWKENPSSRGTVILPDISSGVENLPVSLVNDVDDEKGPKHFTYVTRVKYLTSISSMKPLQGCMCQSVCLPGDANCSCAHKNGGHLPYSSIGFLVSRMSLIYECGTSCQCSVICRNRVTQKGIRLHFEVFRTRDRGWGLRSWDPIRTGTFICEYTGEVIDMIKVDDDGEDNEYIFQASDADEKPFKWNNGTELLGESSPDDSSKTFKPLPITISAKNMGNISRFMNHSCSPNVFWQPVLHDHGDEGYPHIMFFAMKHIPPMTELTYDYGLSRAEVGREEMGHGVGFRKKKKCLCRSSKCRGFFG